MFDFVSFIPRAIVQGIPLLFGSTGETLTEKSGNLNLGIAGIMYVGGISGVIGAFLYEQAAGGAAGFFSCANMPLTQNSGAAIARHIFRKRFIYFLVTLLFLILLD